MAYQLPIRHPSQSTKHRSRGFTLLEMLIYLTALVLVVGMVTSLLLWVVRANSRVHIKNELVVSIDHALSIMANEIRTAQSVYTPTTTSSQLSLFTRNNVPADESSTYIDFFKCESRLCIKREFKPPQAITPEQIQIEALEFTQVKTGVGAAPSVRIVVQAKDGGVSHLAQTTVSLRVYE